MALYLEGICQANNKQTRLVVRLQAVDFSKATSKLEHKFSKLFRKPNDVQNHLRGDETYLKLFRKGFIFLVHIRYRIVVILLSLGLLLNRGIQQKG